MTVRTEGLILGPGQARTGFQRVAEQMSMLAC